MLTECSDVWSSSLESAQALHKGITALNHVLTQNLTSLHSNWEVCHCVIL